MMNHPCKRRVIVVATSTLVALCGGVAFATTASASPASSAPTSKPKNPNTVSAHQCKKGGGQVVPLVLFPSRCEGGKYNQENVDEDTIYSGTSTS